MGDSKLAADFLASLNVEEKCQLFNDLLSVEEVYRSNKDVSFYTFRRMRNAARRKAERRKRTMQYINQHNDELVIQQIHQQNIFRNHYDFKVFYNLQELNFDFVESLLAELRAERQHYHHLNFA